MLEGVWGLLNSATIVRDNIGKETFEFKEKERQGRTSEE